MAVKFLALFILFALAFTVSMLAFMHTYSIIYGFMGFLYFIGTFITMILTVAAAMDEYLNR